MSDLFIIHPTNTRIQHKAVFKMGVYICLKTTEAMKLIVMM